MVAERRLNTKVSPLTGSPLTPLRTLWVTRTSDEEQSDPVVRSLVKIRQESSSSRGFVAQFCPGSYVARACIPEWDRSQANLALKVITVACDRGSLQWTDLQTCGILENWSLRRVGRLREEVSLNRKFACMAGCVRTTIELHCGWRFSIWRRKSVYSVSFVCLF